MTACPERDPDPPAGDPIDLDDIELADQPEWCDCVLCLEMNADNALEDDDGDVLHECRHCERMIPMDKPICQHCLDVDRADYLYDLAKDERAMRETTR